MQMKNIESGYIIDVPFDHAVNVLIPQGRYEPVMDMVEVGKMQVEEDDSLEGRPINEEVTRKQLMEMLDAKDVIYRPAEKKADLLEMVQKAYNIRVTDGNIPGDSQ